VLTAFPKQQVRCACILLHGASFLIERLRLFLDPAYLLISATKAARHAAKKAISRNKYEISLAKSKQLS